jgi:prepilin-type N-terminal cleavage/methylation domain-containing protein/prepilin-type processing-associated H-X9-DG protein
MSVDHLLPQDCSTRERSLHLCLSDVAAPIALDNQPKCGYSPYGTHKRHNRLIHAAEVGELNKPRRGFTLIELLVVIAIIAILAAILFPVFLAAKATASRSKCAGNIGQLCKALNIYSTDYQGRIPDWNSAYGTWDKAVYKYVRNKDIFGCPINRVDPNTHKPYAGTIVVRSYCLAKNVARQITDGCPKPSATVLLLEKGSQPIFTVSDSVAEWFDQTYGYGHDSPDKFWHDRGKNFAFCDGHAAYFKYPQGPFSYDFPNYTGWSTSAYPNNPGGKGYCGYADNTGAAVPGTSKCLAGANMPR